jgi:hypothetical protein
LTTGIPVNFTQANNLFFVMNGTNPTSWHDGTTWTAGGTWPGSASPPTATTAAWLNNYLFLAGNSAHPDWVYISDNLVPQSFQAVQVIKINSGDGQGIKRLENYRTGDVIIYKERSIYDLNIDGNGDSTCTPQPICQWSYSRLSSDVGTPAPRSVVSLGNDQWFLSSAPYAIRSLQKTQFDKTFVNMMSQPIQPIFDGTGSRTINKVQIAKVAAVYFDNKYLIAIPTGSSSVNDLVCVYDFITQSWYLIDGWYPSAWLVYNNNLYYTDANDGRVVQCFSGNIGDFGTAGSYTTMLSHFDGTNAATSYTAETAQVFTFVGAAQLDTSQAAFGVSSLKISFGDSAYLADSDNWNFGSGDFTIDFKVRFSDVTDQQGFVQQYSSGFASWYFHKKTDNTLEFIWYNDLGIPLARYSTAVAPSFTTNTWYHIEIDRNGSNFYMFVDGVLQTLTELTAISSNTLPDIATQLDFGKSGPTALATLKGWMDEVRISKGIARHTAGFTVPDAAYDVSNDPAVPIDTIYISRILDFDNPENFKQLDSIGLEFFPTGNYNASIYIDMDNNGLQLAGTVPLIANAITLPINLPFILASEGVTYRTLQLTKFNEFKKIQVKVEINGLNQQLILQKIAVYGRLKPWRRE